MATTYQFAHNRLIDGVPHLIWGNGIGEVLIPRGTPEEVEALADRSWCDNALADQGEMDMLNVYFRNTTNPSTFYGRLYNDVPIETDTLATLMGEVTGPGYGAVTWAAGLTDFGAPALDSGDMRTLSATKTFTATGVWTAATNLICATSTHATTTGLFIAWSALTTTRALATSDTLDVSIAIKLS